MANKEDALEFEGYKLTLCANIGNCFNIIDECGRVVATVTYLKNGKESYWYVSQETKTKIDRRKFPDKELAFHFVVSVIKAAETQIERRPLPEDIMNYISQRAYDCRRREEQLRAQMLDLQCEKHSLSRLAKKHGSAEATSYVNDADLDELIEELLKFKVSYKEDKKLEEAPFFSETALYNLIGKEDARTILSLMERLLNKVAPEKTHRL